VSVMSGVNGHGHRSVTVKVGRGGIPAGDTMILAFTGGRRSGSGGRGHHHRARAPLREPSARAARCGPVRLTPDRGPGRQAR
jgi:hypothetical protein